MHYKFRNAFKVFVICSRFHHTLQRYYRSIAEHGIYPEKAWAGYGRQHVHLGPFTADDARAGNVVKDRCDGYVEVSAKSLMAELGSFSISKIGVILVPVVKRRHITHIWH